MISSPDPMPKSCEARAIARTMAGMIVGSITLLDPMLCKLSYLAFPAELKMRVQDGKRYGTGSGSDRGT
jgi:hypothetical protein